MLLVSVGLRIPMLLAPLFAFALATGQVPDVPACRVNVNTQPLIVQSVPRADFERAIRPSLFDVEHKHSTSLLTYQIPFDTMWKLTGLSQIFPNPILPCCPGMPAQTPCAEDFIFKKDKNNPASSLATFTWTMRQPGPPISLNANPGSMSLHLDMPRTLFGVASIGPDFVTLQFRDNLISLKAIDKNYPGAPGVPTIVFDGKVQCTATTGQWANLIQLNPGVAIPKLNFLINPTP